MKKYKENIEIDEVHLLKTIELSKLKLMKRKAKYEEEQYVIWWSFFKKESLKYCLLSISISALFCLFSLFIEVTDYSICSFNAGILSLIVFVDFIRLEIHGMNELLMCTKLNPARIFVYKSNIYLFVCLGNTLCLNFILSSCYEINFMTALLVSLVPMYLLSGVMLMLIDKIQNKENLIILYACIYIVTLLLIRLYIKQIERYMSNISILLFIIFSFVFYCLGTYIHVRRMNEREECYIWN